MLSYLQPHSPRVYIGGCNTCFYLTGHLALFDFGLIRFSQLFLKFEFLGGSFAVASSFWVCSS
jgi:hypothetical protein